MLLELIGVLAIGGLTYSLVKGNKSGQNAQGNSANAPASLKNEAKTKEYIRLAMNGLADLLEKDPHPEEPLAALLEVCGTGYSCKLRYMHVNGDPDGVYSLMLIVPIKGSGMECSQYDFNGTTKEFLSYARKPGYDVNRFYERIMRMIQKAEDRRED